MAIWDIDAIDIIVAVVAVAFVASAPTLIAALPAIMIWGLQYGIRRLLSLNGTRDTIAENKRLKGLQHLLPAPDTDEETTINTEMVLRQNKPIDVNVVNGGDNRMWLQKLTQPIEYDGDTATAVLTTTRTKRGQTVSLMPAALKVMPRYIKHTVIPTPPTTTSVPIGYDGLKKEWLWVDFGIDGDAIHALVAGQTGVGKDGVLRLWFTMLTALNSADDIKFVVLDGKGEWLITQLQQSLHMFVPPVGGVEIMQDEKGKWYDAANERMEEAMGVIFAEITRRNKLFAEVNATDIKSYKRKTGIQLPILVIIATDVGTNVEKSFEQLVRLLTFKGRSFGIKLIISMQTVSNQDTGWRNQLSLVMSGFQQAPTADAPTMGVNASILPYRPSQLPAPTNPAHRGIFVVRRGNDHSLVKAPHLSDEDWELFVDQALPKNGDSSEANDLLASLINAPMGKKVAPLVVIEQPRKPKITVEQLAQIRDMAQRGVNKSDIMYEMGFTSGPRWKEMSPFVDKIINRARENRLDV